MIRAGAFSAACMQSLKRVLEADCRLRENLGFIEGEGLDRRKV